MSKAPLSTHRRALFPDGNDSSVQECLQLTDSLGIHVQNSSVHTIDKKDYDDHSLQEHKNKVAMLISPGT